MHLLIFHEALMPFVNDVGPCLRIIWERSNALCYKGFFIICRVAALHYCMLREKKKKNSTEQNVIMFYFKICTCILCLIAHILCDSPLCIYHCRQTALKYDLTGRQCRPSSVWSLRSVLPGQSTLFAFK